MSLDHMNVIQESCIKKISAFSNFCGCRVLCVCVNVVTCQKQGS
jgi:hypothetical protein